MKKLLVAALLAVCVLTLSQQQASAWVNSRFGVGLNWDYQSGGNSFLWGLWRNGQIPGPEVAGGGGYGAPRYGYPQQSFSPGPQGYMAPQAMPMQGFNQPMYPNQGFAPGFQGGVYEPQPALDPSLAYGTMNFNNPYQFANYPRPVYYYPTYGYGR